MASVYIALLHHPVYNKQREIVTTCISGYDLHDIARAARAYGIKKYFVVTPIPSQQTLAKEIVDHWISGHGATYNPTRKEAMELLSVVPKFDTVLKIIENTEKNVPKIVITSSKRRTNVISYHQVKAWIASESVPLLVVFGTGWGLTDEICALCDHQLEPILEKSDYNHLSVRSACSIVLDRLLGD